MAYTLSTMFREKISKSKDFRQKNEATQSVGYSTGYLNFDFINGAMVFVKTPEKEFSYYSVGVADGSMIMVIGRSGCGKTTLVEQMAANIVRPFATSTVFEDQIEVGSNNNRKESITGYQGEEFKQKFVVRDTGITAENIYERVKMIHDMKLENRDTFEYNTGLLDTLGKPIIKMEPTVYIIDSLALLMPENLTEEEQISGQMSATAMAKTNAALFKRLIPMLKVANIILYVINHINQEIVINPKQRKKSQVSYLKQGESLPGGNAPIYLSNNIIRVDDNSKLKKEEAFGIDGSLVDVSLVKSRSNKAGKSCTLVFNQEIGFDPDLSLFVMLKNAGRVKGAGAYLYIGDRDDIKFSQKQFKEKLYANPELQDEFMKQVMEELKTYVIEPMEQGAMKQSAGMSNDILSRMNSMQNVA